VFLTAMTPSYYASRRRLLDREGLIHPMIATERSKDGVIAELIADRAGPVVFVDDLPPNLHGVRRSVPQAHLVHLMADKSFRPYLPELPAGAHTAGDWYEAEPLLRGLLSGARASLQVS
ncbi:hypothetical protein, partial [Acinetobacter baumannii]|uniref:hypothetical protein n=1 Tax=Acinetobacter baumannii TaxID=470 RepID=UPI0018E09BA1